MKTISKRPRLAWRKIAACLTLGLLMAGTVAAPAHAFDRDWHGHEVRARDWHRHYRPGYGPGVVYAPPVVYSPPPPVESPGLNLIIPFNIH